MALLSFVDWIEGFELCGLSALPIFVHPAIDVA
jgi:hypothetical protein